MLERLTDTADLAKIESRFINLISRTFLKGALGKPGPKLKNSVRQAFSSKTYEVQLDKIIDDIYLVSVGYTDDRVKEVSTGKPLGSSRTSTKELISKVFSFDGSMPSSGSSWTWSAAAKKPLPITEEAVRATKGMVKEVSESIIRILEDEGIYTKHPTQLEKRIRDLWDGSKYKATRFARTFTADVATNTAVHRYKEQGISLLQFYAEIDDRTTEQCRALHGTVIPTNSRDIQKYRPPLHMHCRSDLLPVPLGYKVDPDLLIENRDFTKQLDQDFSLLDVVDQDVVTNAFKNIDDFNDNYRVDKFILDEDVELRLMRLNIKIETVEPKEEGPTKPDKPGEIPQKLSFKHVKTREEAKTWLEENTDMKYVELEGLDADTVNELIDSYITNYNLDPRVHEGLEYVGTCQQQAKIIKEKLSGHLSVPESCYAWSIKSPVASGIGINKRWGKDYLKFSAEIEKNVRDKWHPEGCYTIKSVMDHEYGHLLDDLYKISSDKTDPDVKKLREIFDKKTLDPATSAEDLSYYAFCKNPKEMYAEGWAEYLNNPNPRPLAKQIGETIIKFINKNKK